MLSLCTEQDTGFFNSLLVGKGLGTVWAARELPHNHPALPLQMFTMQNNLKEKAKLVAATPKLQRGITSPTQTAGMVGTTFFCIFAGQEKAIYLCTLPAAFPQHSSKAAAELQLCTRC